MKAQWLAFGENRIVITAPVSAEQGMPIEPSVIRREHIEAFVADQVSRWRPNTAATATWPCCGSFAGSATKVLTD